MMSRSLYIIPLAVLLPLTPLVAQGRIEYEDYRLDNGLRVVLVEDHSAPVVTVNVWYHVGSANERPSRSGFAHLFEHMMFQGSANVDKAEHMQLIERAGGSMNGTTNEDRTNYFETVPANRLNLALWLEADRMRSLAVNEENLDNQRNAVQEERRLRVDNQPYTGVFFEGLTSLWDSTTCFAYAHSVIGSMEDLNAADVSDVQSFFDMYYAPGNATLVVAGDFDPDNARSLIRQYFGDIASAPSLPRAECGWEIGTESQEVVWEDAFANLPGVALAYRAPSHRDEDTPALQLLGLILGDGESSRLNRALVREQQSAVTAFAQMNSRRMSSVMIAFAVANQGTSAEQLAEQLHAAFQQVLDDGITEEELTKAKNSFRASDIFGRQTTMAIAEEIQHFALYHESLDEIHTDLDRYMAVTREDILRAARRYLAPENRVTFLIVPQNQRETPVP